MGPSVRWGNALRAAQGLGILDLDLGDSPVIVNIWAGSMHVPGLVNIQKAIENHHRNSGFSHETW